MAGCLLGELDFTFLIDACLRHQNQVVCLCGLVNLPSIRACQGNLFSGSGMESTGSSSCVVFRCQRLDVSSCLIAVYSNDTILAACLPADIFSTGQCLGCITDMEGNGRFFSLVHLGAECF